VAQVLQLPLAELATCHVGAGFHERPADEIDEGLVYELPGARVWGVTARILYDFLELISRPGVVERA
jgi:hypothetical protein